MPADESVDGGVSVSAARAVERVERAPEEPVRRCKEELLIPEDIRIEDVLNLY